MRVSNLQQFLRTLESPLEALGLNATTQKGVTARLRELADALQPLSDYGIDELADLVALARDYRASGVLPDWALARQPKVRESKPRAAKAPKLTVDDAQGIMRTLIERCHLMEPSAIEAEVKRLSALTVGDLKVVQRDVLSTTIGKKKDDMIAALLQAVNNHRKSRDRIETIMPGDVPPSTSSKTSDDEPKRWP